MLRTLQGYWTNAAGYQRFLYGVAALLLASAVFHTGVLLVTGGTLEGDTSWRKPILFGEAFGITTATIAWVMTFLPRRPRLCWVLAIALGVANVLEVAWVSFQQWRGVPSHFNSDSAFDEALFSAAGVTVVVTMLVILVVTVWSFVSLSAPAPLAAALRAGLALLIVGLLLGVLMIVNGGHTFGDDGDLKVAHALGLHAAQVLPALAWVLLFTRWSELRRRHITMAAIAAYAVLVAVTAAQALRGLAPYAFDTGSAVLVVAALAVLLGSALMAAAGLRERSRGVSVTGRPA
jgi:hypothetical protein